MSEDASAPYQVLSDTPASSAGQDHLDFLPYASALATLIDRKATATPLVAAISAPWGAGKTTLARLVQEQLRVGGEWDEPHVICQFNAWKHDDAPHLGAAFAAEVAQCATRHRHWWTRVFQPLPSVMLSPAQRWRRKVYIGLIALYLAGVLVVGGHTMDLLGAIVNPKSANWATVGHYVHGWALSLVVILAAVAFVYPKVLSGTQAVGRFVMDPRSEAAQGAMGSVRDQLGKLIRGATRGHRRFIIFVDDLERCRPPRAVEICEVASQLLDHEGVVTVLVGDMETIAMSAAIKYRSLELPSTDQQASEELKTSYARYGRAYLQKIVTLQFDLPPATPQQLRNMLQTELRPPPAPNSSPPDTKPSRGRRAPSADSATRITVAAVGGAVAAALGAAQSNETRYSLTALVGVLVSLVVLGIVPIVIFRLIRRRARRNRERIDQAIQRESEGTTADEAAESVPRVPRGLSPDEVRKRYLSRVLDTTGIAARADDIVFEFLPIRPRAAKRLFNQVRLMLLIAISRGLFVRKASAEQNRRADLIAKWLVLRERWPEVARDPDRIRGLEDTANNGALQERLPDLDDVDDLANLLTTDPPFEDLGNLLFFSF